MQFDTLFRDGLYFKLAAEANQQAMRIKQAFQTKGIPFWMDSVTNQQFVVLRRTQAAALAERYVFEFSHEVDGKHICVRFCTSWSTDASAVDALIRDIEKL